MSGVGWPFRVYRWGLACCVRCSSFHPLSAVSRHHDVALGSLCTSLPIHFVISQKKNEHSSFKRMRRFEITHSVTLLFKASVGILTINTYISEPPNCHLQIASSCIHYIILMEVRICDPKGKTSVSKVGYSQEDDDA